MNELSMKCNAAGLDGVIRKIFIALTACAARVYGSVTFSQCVSTADYPSYIIDDMKSRVALQRWTRRYS